MSKAERQQDVKSGALLPIPKAFCCEVGEHMGLLDQACPVCMVWNSELMRAVYGDHDANR